ncbi:MAG: TonB-dependent receptor [Alistipes sp.]|nr:TonB-dependent receptor [Alistipes sp.]
MKRFFVLSAAAIAVCHNASAEEVTLSDSLTIHTIEQVNIVTSRATEKSPIPHTELSYEQIESCNFGEDIPSLLSSMPSVVCSSESGIGIGSTSFRVRGTDPTRINVTLNGVPMNDAETHSVYWYDTPDLISSVGSVQLQRGVGLSTAGTGAFGASLAMNTLAPQVNFSGRASLSYGSFNTQKQEVAISSGLLGGHWTIDGRLSHLSSDGYVDRAKSNLHSYLFQAGYYKGGTTLKLLSFGGVAKVYLTYTGVTAEQLESDRRYNPEGEIWGYRPTASGEMEYAVVGYFDDHTDNYTQINNQLILNHRFSDSWQLNATAHYTYGNGYYLNYKNDQKLSKYGFAPIAVGSNTVERTNLLRRKSMTNHFGGLVAAARYNSRALQLDFGGSVSLYDGVHFGTISALELAPDFAEAEYYRNATTKYDCSLFARADLSITERLNLYADLQFRHITHTIAGVNDNYDPTISAMQRLDIDRNYNFLNPKLGLYYTPNDHHALYISAAVGQKEPTRNNFTDIREGEYPTAEQMLDLEGGYTLKSKVVTANINLYYMLYRNQLVQTGELSDTGELLSRNIPKSYRRGVELMVDVRATKWLTLGANATLSQNHILDYVDNIDGTAFERGRTTIAYSPAIIAGAYIEAATHGFVARLSTRYVSKQYLTNGQYEDLTLPRYTVSDLNLAYTLGKVRFGVKIGNLFNAHYCASGYGGSWLEGPTLADRKSWAYYFPQATTSVLANITVKW